MKIRQKITLWICGTAFFAAVAFSAFIFLELLEEPIRLIDKELQYMADALFEQGKDDLRSPWKINRDNLPYSPDRYWIKVFDHDGNILYRSAMTQFTDISPAKNKKHYTVEETIPRELVTLGQDAHDKVVYRVRIIKRQLGGLPVTMRIAKPVEELKKELLEVLRDAAFALAGCTLLIVIISYTLAGKILQPVVTINQLVRDIRDKSLDRRIPIGQNRDELAILAESLNKMFDRLQYSFTRQKEFVGNASHELKSPITLLMLTQEELLMNPALPANARKDMERQLNTMRRMSKLIRNMLDLSRLEQQETLNIETIDLRILTKRVLEDYRDMLTAAGITVEVDMAKEIFLQGDREKLLRLLINLIDNAVRYNDARDGRLSITGKRENDSVIIEVANTGRIIPADDLKRVFDQFYRVEKSRSQDHGGSGLGLTIAGKIVELHGGNIRITSNPEGWTRVIVTLPVHHS